MRRQVASNGKNQSLPVTRELNRHPATADPTRFSLFWKRRSTLHALHFSIALPAGQQDKRDLNSRINTNEGRFRQRCRPTGPDIR